MKCLRILCMLLMMSSFSTSAVGETNSWSKLALQDLAAIKSELEENHPGAVDRENPKFALWMKQGYVEASELAKTADSLEGYYFALRRYAKGFNDTHLRIHLYDEVENNNNNLWPGFTVALHNEQFIVSDLSGIGFNVAQGTLPQPGDILRKCDGKSAKELFASNILPFYGVSGLSASERSLAPRLMFDEGNPYIERPKRCTFSNQSGQYALNLIWQPISSEQKQQITYFAAWGEAPEISFRKIKPGIFWITLSSFDAYDEQTISQLRGVINAASENKEALRSSDVIVFDVRGNGGGSATWGQELLESIWGKGFVERLPGSGAEAVEWRASKDNIAELKEVLPQISKALGEDSDGMRFLKDAIAGMEQARERGDQYYRERGEFVSDDKAIREGEVTPKIYLLSDGVCKSACLDLADWVLSIPNAELIGAETSADTEYIENRAALLPGNKAYLWLSMKVYRGRVRGSNQPYRPTHQWNGKNWDTKELQDWVLELSAK